MGQKSHPIGFRVGITKDWNSHWYAKKQDFGRNLIEDVRIKKFVNARLSSAAVSKVEVDRTSEELKILIHTARPGIVIGRKGQEVEQLTEAVIDMTNRFGSSYSHVSIDIKEVQSPELNARLVAKNVAEQISKRMPFRRAMKRAVEITRQAGAKGVRIKCSGRLGGAEIARSEHTTSGSLPLQTLDADIDYAIVEARTTTGRVGVKVWIYRGILSKTE